MKNPWFKNWFGETYRKLYPHRDLRQADAQVKSLLEALPVMPGWSILDVGCGSGRHLEMFQQQGCSGIGLDLSPLLLREARLGALTEVRGDMRHLPFRPASFDLAACFFTSFGYFATLDEDVQALAQFAGVLKPGGYFFLDLINKTHLLKNLVPRERCVLDGSPVEQYRRFEGGMVIKEIEIKRPDGQVEKFEERVRLYEEGELFALAERFSLRPLRVFGDECGGAYQAETSLRMAALFQKDR